MNNPPYQGVANQLAQYGRFGDSQLVHMNPIEVQMLSRLSPTGQLTRNPQTGQPEAFLPFLAPLLGSFLGNAALGTTLTTALGSKALGAAAAGALGSAAATTAVTGDLEKGIMSGITGFGIGSALGGLGELAKTGADVAQTAPAVADAASTVATAAPDLATVAPAVGEGFGASISPIADTAVSAAPSVAEVLPEIGEGFTAGAGTAGTVAGRVLPEPSTFGQRLIDPLRQPGDLFKQLAEPGSFLPIYVGETGRIAREQELAGRGSMRDYQEQQDAERRKTLAQMSNVFNQVRSAYPNIGYARGGQVEGYFDGGDIENQIRNALNQGGYNAMPDAENVQLALRGAEYVPPPAASYAALDVGGEGYLPGISGEFQYFREPTPPPPAAVDPGSMPGGGDIVGGGYFDPNFDFEGFLNQRGGYRNYLDLFGGGAGMPPTQEGQVDFISPSMERDVFAGGTPNFDERTGTYIPGGMPGMDFGNLEEFLSQYSPDAAQPAPTSPGTPTPFPQSMETPLDFLSEFEPGFNPDMMGGMSPALPPTVQPEPTRPPVNPLSARRAEGFEDLPSNQPTLDLLRETFDRMSTQPPPPQMPAPQIPPGMGRIEDSFVARPLPEPVPPGFNDNFAELIATPQMPSGGIADLVASRQMNAPMPSRAELSPSIDREMAQPAFDYEEFLAEMRGMPSGRFGFAEGGMTSMEGDMNPMQSDMAPQDELVMMTVAAIRGEIENADEIISAFVDQYGSEAFMQLREQVLQDIVPNAQTEGMVEGMGGGQDDMVEGMIGSQRPVAVSPGEYIIPADAVALAGGGYSGDGAKFFDGLVDDIRQRTMGTTEQVRPYQGRGM